ncbi:hypothetical protein PIROE2DRAFT_9412 [Piromyces sp. E2]|nr:hypothetical protein PIROE2DRAFT_9412 [Piromyces sp. E2]|eukprot:OUM63952.1 hypothetical protein PIROE2DRAFT_9412 [Piromyces sp. E2]
MGLDIYVGTLTRYYKHNWKTVVQKMAERLGIECKIVRAYEEMDVTVDRVLSDTKKWEELLLKSIIKDGEPLPPWTEDYDTTPYYTDKPDWDAIGALMMYIAYNTYKQPLPKMVSKNHDFFDDELVKKSIDDKEKVFSLIQGGGWWVPLDDPFMFRFPLMNGREIPFGTSGLLKRELEIINSMEWNATEEEIIQWAKTEGYPTDITVQSNKVENNDKDDNPNSNHDNNSHSNETSNDNVIKKNHDENGNSHNENNCKDNPKWNMVNKTIHKEYDTVSLAKFAFSIMWQAANFSLKHRVPIIYDS